MSEVSKIALLQCLFLNVNHSMLVQLSLPPAGLHTCECVMTEGFKKRTFGGAKARK